MVYREVHCVESREVIRRWQAGLGQRRIAGGTGVSRPTVRRYIEAAGLRPGGAEPSEEQLARLARRGRALAAGAAATPAANLRVARSQLVDPRAPQ